MEKRVILALGLSLLILIGYQAFMSKRYPPVRGQAPSEVRGQTPSTERSPVGTVSVPSQEEESPTEIQEILPTEEQIIIKNELFTITFTDVGAAIKEVTLNKNKKAGLTIPYDIFKAKSQRDSIALFFPDKFGSDLNKVKYNVTKSEDQIIFSHSFNNEFIVEKRFHVSNSLYLIELDITFKNIKNSDISKQYSLVSTVHMPSSSMDERYLEISANLDGKILKNKKSGRAFEIQRAGNLSWIMLKNRYFSIIMKPFNQSFGYLVKQDKAGKLTTTLTVQPFIIPSNSGITHKYGLYLGPSSPILAKEANIGVETALTHGALGSIGQLLMSVLKFFHKVTGSWGISILLLTLFINIVLFPLTRKSYKSMQEMQILQPKIEKLRQENKNNPQKLQKGTMELYKKYKINPMGGCLPLLLQMPIFFALYQGLMNFVELRGAGFLWIKDLSVPENVPLPVTLPLIRNSINILPLLMIVAMFFQQRLSSKFTSMSQTDEQRHQQKVMTIMMTVMFGFIFYNMPSGFVLYWLCSTVIMTLMQVAITKKPKQLVEYA